MVTPAPGVTSGDLERLQAAMAAAQRGDIERASDMSEAALRDGLEHPLFFRLRGVRRERQGRLEEAVADFQRALADAPRDPMLLNALGLCLGRTGRLGQALQAMDRAVELQPGQPALQANRGWVLENLGRLTEARRAYEQAIAADPRFVRALGALAAIAARQGRTDEARGLAMRALALAPADAGGRLALGMAELADGRAEAAEQAARPVAAAVNLPPHERGVASALLGDALDLQGRTNDAFQAYRDANLHIAEAQRGRAPGERGSDLARRLIAEFEALSPADWDARPAPGEAPRRQAFIVGFARTGTTLLGQILAAHPDAEVLDEQEILSRTGQGFVGDGGLKRLAAAEPVQVADLRRAYVRQARDLAPDLGGRLLVDKLPMNVLGLPLVSRLFPEARVVVARRDPRDVVLSCFRRQFVLSGASREFLDLERAAHFYADVMGLAERYIADLPLTVRIQRYEDLVADFEGETRGLCAFLGLPWTEALHGFGSARQALDVATPSAGQVRRGLYAEGVGQWRRYRDQLAPVLPILQPWIERYGYEPE